MAAPAAAEPACRDAGVIPVQLAGWCGWVAADTASGTADLRRYFRIYGAEGRPTGRSGVQVSFRDGRPRIGCRRGGEAVDPLSILHGPEWKRFQPLGCDGAGGAIEYEDAEIGRGAALRRHRTDVEVLREGHWPLYVQLALLGLVLREHPVFTLHAATCAYRGTALVFVGPSGAGKSTLCWALQQAGADYYGDELAFFSLPDYSLWPLPHRLALRPGGAGKLGLAPRSEDWYEHRTGDPKLAMSVREPSQPCPPEAVNLFLLGGFGERPEIRPVRSGDAMRRLLRGMGSRDPGMGARLELLAGLLERYPCRELVLGHPAETAERLLTALETER